MDIYVVLLLIFIIAPISTFVHELGHVFGAKWAKADSIILSLGSGKKIAALSYKQIQFSIHTLFFLGGLAYNKRDKPYKPMEIIWISLCGPIGNGIAATVVFCLVGFSYGPVRAFVLFNIWLGLINMIPFRLNGKQSDGYTIVQTICRQAQHSNE
ncbi:site-2 protease family protein [Lentibacillus sp. N15]|uniref:site-2 protease family protein n=1 Tax=Lentibacillus songyuanensis TaxID=3136161 RepID=UPI0031BB5C32